MKGPSLFDTVVDRNEDTPVRPIMYGEVVSSGGSSFIYDDAGVTLAAGRSAGADTLIYDPPWDNVPPLDYAGFARVLAFCDGNRATDILRVFGSDVSWVYTWDCVSSWYVPGQPLRRAKLCLAYGPFEDNYRLPVDRDVRPRRVSNSRGAYVHIPDARGVRISDVYSHAITQLHAGGGHRHSKPQEWIDMLIANHAGAVVVDPFCGSGTTIGACLSAGKSFVCGDNDRSCALQCVGLMRA